MVPRNLIRDLPPFLLALLAVSVVVPLWSLRFLAPPWELASGSEIGVVSLCAFYFGPAAVVTTILLRTPLLLAAFTVECIALAAHVFASTSTTDPLLVKARLFLLVGLSIIGVVFSREDVLFPLLQKRWRGFRKVGRMKVTEKAYVVARSGDFASPRIPMMLENVSRDGLGVSGPSDLLGPLLSERGRGGALSLEMSVGSERFSFDATIVWFRIQPPLVQLGLSTVGVDAVARYISALERRDGSKTKANPFHTLAARGALRKLGLLVWIVCLVGTFLVPACGSSGVAP